MTSGRLSSAETSVPMTNPPCTAIVSHAVVVAARWNSATIGAVAAVAENHIVIPRNMASDSQASCRCGERVTRSTAYQNGWRRWPAAAASLSVASDIIRVVPRCAPRRSAMTNDEARAFFTRFLDVWKRESVSGISEFYTETARVESPVFHTVTGRTD